MCSVDSGFPTTLVYSCGMLLYCCSVCVCVALLPDNKSYWKNLTAHFPTCCALCVRLPKHMLPMQTCYCASLVSCHVTLLTQHCEYLLSLSSTRPILSGVLSSVQSCIVQWIHCFLPCHVLRPIKFSSI